MSEVKYLVHAITVAGQVLADPSEFPITGIDCNKFFLGLS